MAVVRFRGIFSCVFRYCKVEASRGMQASPSVHSRLGTAPIILGDADTAID